MADQELVCRACGTTFAFTEAEQEFFRAQGFTNPPRRCKPCRAKARRRSGRGRPGGGSVRVEVRRPGDDLQFAGRGAAGVPLGAGADTVRAQPSPGPAWQGGGTHARGAGRSATVAHAGPLHTTTCSLCGVQTDVPFVPDGVRPVYCLPCLKRQTR